MAGYFQRDQGKGVVMPVLSATPTFAEERTSDYLSPNSQAMAEGVYRFFWASFSEIPSGSALLLNFHWDIKPGGDNKPSCDPEAEVGIFSMGYSRRTGER